MHIGVIGCGAWGNNHARALARLGALRAVADRDASVAHALAAETRSIALTPDAMLNDPLIAGIVLALPPALHGSFALRVLETGKHLLVEKPMALESATALAIVDRAARGSRVAMTGHLLRFHPAFTELARLVSRGTFGRLRHIETTRLGLGRFYPGADALWDLAPHDLSLILALTGTLPVDERIDSHCLLEPGSIDMAHLHLTFGCGVTAHCHISRVTPTAKDRRFVVLCEGAALVFDDGQPWERKLAIHRCTLRRADACRIAAEVSPVEYATLPRLPPLDAELAHFIDCIESGARPISDATEGAIVLGIVERLRDGALAPVRSWAGLNAELSAHGRTASAVST